MRPASSSLSHRPWSTRSADLLFPVTPTPMRWEKWCNSALPEARQTIDSDPGSLEYLPFALYCTFPRSQPDPVDNELRDTFVQLGAMEAGRRPRSEEHTSELQ